MFLSCLLQKPVDSDEIWYTHSWLLFQPIFCPYDRSGWLPIGS